MREYNCLKKNIYKKGDFVLIPIRDEDKYDIMKWRNQQLYHLRQNAPLTKKKQDNYFEVVIENLFFQPQPEQILFSCLKQRNFIAYGGLVHIDWDMGSAEISFVMDSELEQAFFVEFWVIFLELIEQVAFIDLELNKIFTYAFDVRPKLYEALNQREFKSESNFTDTKLNKIRIHSKHRI